MDIWKALPPDTNTLHVVKLDDPPSGEMIEWTPDPGLRTRVYGGAFTVTTPAVVPHSYFVWELWSGSDVIMASQEEGPLAPRGTYRIFLGRRRGVAAGGIDLRRYLEWNDGMYLVHGLVLKLGTFAMVVGMVVKDGVLYVDSWYDMRVKTA